LLTTNNGLFPTLANAEKQNDRRRFIAACHPSPVLGEGQGVRLRLIKQPQNNLKQYDYKLPTKSIE
jgi:hypothetical protein